MTMKALIKPANAEMIRRFANGQHEPIPGNKLKALVKLTEKKGEQITGVNSLDKVLEFAKDEFLGLDITHYSVNFFPCKVNVLYFAANPLV